MKRALIPFVVAFSAAQLGCIWSPSNRGDQPSGSTLSLSGYTLTANESVSFTAKNLTTGGTTTFGPTTTGSSPMTFDTSLFPWSLSFTPTNDFWAPQLPYNGLAHSLGRIEITGFANASGPATLDTFSPAAETCVLNKMNAGESAHQAGSECSDGKSLVIFDNDGVGNGPETTGWVPDTTLTDTSASPAVSVQVGHYAVQGNTVYGLICKPISGTSFPMMLINHGGFGADDTTLTECKNAARDGWLAAASVYRGESLVVQTPPFSTVTPTTFGVSDATKWELCLGEVTDVLRLLAIVRGRTDVDTTRALMWGHSHGACVTMRAVEQGAQVKGAAAFAPPTDFLAWEAWGASLDAIVGASPTVAPIAYQWRSAVSMKTDLTARTDVKTFLVHGDSDMTVPTVQTCELANGAWGTTSQNFYPNNLSLTAPTACASSGLTWQTSFPSSWTTNTVLVVENGTHTSIITNPSTWAMFQNFVLSMGMPNPGAIP